ncbi:unnamed protein product [Urochloa decumbens]|uniref:Uncharacterized protein n=1 Tax=Urochloa decumbens TaxID=240449 RepID=A0ABC8YT87_9POAL
MNNSRHQYSLKEDLYSVRTFVLITFWLSSPIWFWLLRALPPKFSVQLVDARGLDAPPPAHDDAPLSTAFNMTLHVTNRRLHDVCYRHGEAAVRYSGFTVAWARTRAFCVGKKEARDVPVVAWADGLGVPSSLRERLAADVKRAGAVELEVDVRLFRGDDGSARPTLLSCKAAAAAAAMMHQRRSVHVGDAAWQCPPFTLPRFFISYMCEFALFTWLLFVPWYYLFYDLPPQFSVQLAPVGRGLDTAALAAPSISPAFHVALHASNRRATERCYGHGEGAVSYAGFTVASGRVPGFCVPAKGSREVLFLAREDGVGLPEHLRDRMAAASKVGALELEVEVRLFQGGDYATSGRPTRMWCKARMGGARPPELTACTVLALQNWFGVDSAD